MAKVTLISGITRFIAFLFKIYLSRQLGAEMLGVYQIAMSIFVLFMAIPSSGIPTSLSRHIAGFNAKGDVKNARGMLTSSLIISTTIAIIIVALCFAFPNLTSLLFTDKRCFKMFLIMLPALISTSIYAIIRSYFWGNKMFMLYSMSELLEEIVSVIMIFSTIVFTLFSNDLSYSIAVAFVISDYISTIVLIVTFFLKGGKLSKPSMIKELTSSSLPMTSTRLLGSILSSMMALLLPVLLIKYGMSSHEATACYGRASGMVMPLIFIPSTVISALIVVIVPELAAMKSKGQNISQSISNAISLSLVIACLFLSVFITSGDKITSIIYKDTIAGEYMKIACYLMIPMSINQIVVNILNTLGHENTTFLTHIFGSVILSIIILIMPKYIGIYAYFVGLLIFHSVTAMIYLYKLNKIVNLDKKLPFTLSLLLIFTIMLAYMTKLISKIVKNDIVYIFVASIIECIIYLIFIIKRQYLKVNLAHLKISKK